MELAMNVCGWSIRWFFANSFTMTGCTVLCVCWKKGVDISRRCEDVFLASFCTINCMQSSRT